MANVSNTNAHASKDASGKLKALEGALDQIKKRYGDNAIMRLTDDHVFKVDVISTGSLGLDRALGIGGLPRGRITEIFGPESSGKTTLALQVIANAQKSGGVAAYIDAEHALDPKYARSLGINLDTLLISQPDYGEQALEIVEQLISSGAVDVVVVDSVAALVPKAELEGEMGDQHVGLQARLMSKSMRKLSAVISRTNSCAIFINQIREKIGVMFGSPETTPGGRALKFFSSVRIDIRRTGQIKSATEVIGNRTKAKVVKNKVAAPFREAEFDIIYSKGINWVGEVLDQAVEEGICGKKGTWLSYGDLRIGQGRENAIAYLEENREVQAEIQAKVIERLWPTLPPAGEGADVAAADGTAADGTSASSNGHGKNGKGRKALAAEVEDASAGSGGPASSDIHPDELAYSVELAGAELPSSELSDEGVGEADMALAKAGGRSRRGR